jgi:hypothetical protein
MGTPNYYDLSGPSTRIAWYPNGQGLAKAGGPAAGAPVLVYSGPTGDVAVSGDGLTVSKTPAGTFVVAVIKGSQIVPGAVVSFGVLIPDVNVSNAGVAVNTFGALSTHRGTSQLGPGQLEQYTEMALTGTAANIELPAAAG